MLAIGLSRSELPALKRGIEAAREAQSGWIVVRDRNKSEAQQERETAGAELRSDFVAALRWNLRHDRVAQATLDAIQQGDGVEDLIQDLGDLAALAERHRGAFDNDETFDVDAKIEEARSSASAIRAGVSQARSANKPNDAKLLRDRAFTYLEARVSTIREAGRYAFRKEPGVRMRFSSAYLRGKRRRAKPIPAEPEATAARRRCDGARRGLSESIAPASRFCAGASVCGGSSSGAVSTLPDGVLALADGVSALPGGVPALPDGVPALPDGVPALPDGVPALPDGLPALPDIHDARNRARAGGDPVRR